MNLVTTLDIATLTVIVGVGGLLWQVLRGMESRLNEKIESVRADVEKLRQDT